ncbi:amidohydrolase family protein [Streptomyces olivochromogenes]|uniref:Amidohydrolase n=1 Tax=Streptomyces olivochromogenes TaxID=1963 RepID=A0A250VRG4_STROL|nr:amidohydrolase family protein [Streptomyces olivochromogenes]KUN43931.1 amidohydrolase [Streptomyces olivochromogenes]GAX56803.1 amidohydrolase [Streptomyces olivochromogenes]
MLITDVEVEGYGRVDVRLGGGRIVGIGRRRAGRGDVDGRGGALLVGLHDHHVHLAALAAEAASVRVGPAQAGDRDGLVRALRSGPPGEWVRAVGYHESVAGELDRRMLDDFAPDRPVRVQHRSGALWMWNSAALRAAGLDGGGDGRFWREDERLRGFTPPVRLDLRGVGARAAAYGITGFTNADPRPGQDLPELLSVLPQRLVVMGIGDAPVKFLLDDATLPTPDELAASVAAVRPRPVAVHCVTRVQLLVTLLALDEVGPVAGDRIEHGSVIPAETMPWLARLGVTVVTQPHFPVERGREYATDVDPDDQAHLYRCRSLAEAGILLAAGTDAPYGSADPWAVMRAAVERSRGEAVDRRAALGLFAGEPQHPSRVRRLTVGAVADLCLLHVPLKEALDLMSADVVRATFVGGRRITPPEPQE